MELALDASIAVSALGISEWRGGFDWSPMNFGEGTAKNLAVGRGGVQEKMREMEKKRQR